MAVTIIDHTYNAKRFNPLVYDEKVIRYSKTLRPGTLDYDDFWDEQDDRCLFGYKPKGMNDITGEHYFHLNMNQIEMLPQGEARKRLHAPYYREIDNRLFKITYDAKKNRYGIIVGKPRRVGLSEFGAVQQQYELTMHLRNRVGICAGKQEKADDFYKKVLSLFKNVRPEYAVARLYKNDKEMKLGYFDIENKQQVECGLESEMLIRTMFVDSAGFEGTSMSLVIFEEAGLFSNLIASYKSTEPCFKDGAVQFGTPLIYGTGGQIEKGSKGYMDMWENHVAYNLEKVFIPAYEYYPGDGETDQKTGIQQPSFFDLRTGRTNQEAALKHILEQRKIASKSKEGITKHIQSYPIKESEIFIKSKGGILDRILLNNQKMAMEEGMCPYDIRQGKLEWIDDERTIKLLNRCKDTKEKTKLRIKNKSKLRWIDDPTGSIYKLADPINHDDMDHKPDIAGCDSYDEEVAEGTGSNGATLVYRTYAGPTRDYNMPIAVLCERGDSGNDDVFYENNVKLAIYYNYELLFEYSKIAVESYFKDVGAEKYLKEKPDLRKELGTSKAQNHYGQRMTPDVKILGTKLLKAEVKNNSGNIWFLNVLLDLIDFGDGNTDIAMAYMMVLLYKLELFEQIVDENDYEDDDYDSTNIFSDMLYYEMDAKGHVGIKTYNGNEVTQMETFNPDIHLNDYDKREIQRKRTEEKKQLEEIKKTFDSKRKLSFQELIQEEILRNIKHS